MKKKTRILIVIALVSLLIVIIANFSFADTTGLGDLSQYKGDTDGSDIFKQRVGKIADIAQVIGSITSVVVLIVIGIKYMLGSVEEKAEYKKTLLPYLIGAIIVFGISSMLGMIFNVANDLL